MNLHEEVQAAFGRGDNERVRELADELRRSGDDVEGLCWLFEEALAEARARSFDGLLPYLVLDRGVIAVEEGDAETGVKLLASGQAVFDAEGELVDPDDAAEVERARERARKSLDAETFARAEEEGRRLSL